MKDNNTFREIGEKLLEADKILTGNFGWLSSVALWTDGSECRMNRQKQKKIFSTHIYGF